MIWAFDDEQRYVARVLATLGYWADRALTQRTDMLNHLTDLQAWMFDQLHGRKDAEGVQEAAIALQHMTHINALLGHDTAINRKLLRMAQRPYFARLWFSENEAEDETIVIGFGSIIEPASRDMLVNDWRAPVSKLYYDCEPGPCVYDAPLGEVRVHLRRKQVVRIEQGQLTSMHDADLAIADDMLLEVLDRSADMHMKQVIATIQRDQYDAIRDQSCDVLILTGPAGSGKTTVALHRVAFLLYRMRATLKAENVRILSPTSAFSEAISSVLPDLGEEHMPISTLHDVAGIKLNLPVEGALPGFERAFASGESDVRRSFSFFHALQALASEMDEHPPLFEDIAFQGRVIASAEELRHLYTVDMIAVKPVLRLYRIRLRVAQILDELEKALSEQFLEKLKTTVKPQYRANMARLKAMEALEPTRMALHVVTTIDLPAVYKRQLERFGLSDNGLCANRHAISEDAIPLLWLALRLGMTMPDHTVRCLVADEAQDFTPLQIATLRALYPNAQATFLGDQRQSIWPGESSGLVHIPPNFPVVRTRTAVLSRSYRNAAPIAAYCAQLDDIGNTEAFGRPGEPVRELQADTPMPTVAQEARALMNGKCKTVALITSTSEKAEAFARLLPEAKLIAEDSFLPNEGLIILPLFLCKGLEFDAVVVYWPEDKAQPANRRMLYTACSRALHCLIVVS